MAAMILRVISWLFSQLYCRAVVRDKSLEHRTKHFRLLMEEKGAAECTILPEQVCITLVQEAYKRAAEQEADKIARYGKYYDQMNVIADTVIAAIRNEPNVDLRIVGILKFNSIL